MKFIGKCPITGKEETIYCENINCTTLDGRHNYIPGLMYACSVDPSGYNLCKKCPINSLNNKIDEGGN